MTQLWNFLKNFPKRLKIYIKTATAYKNCNNLPEHEKKRVVRTIKKEVLGMTIALKIMKDDRVVVGAQAEGLLR